MAAYGRFSNKDRKGGAKPDLPALLSESSDGCGGEDAAHLEEILVCGAPANDFRCVDWLVDFSRVEPELLPVVDDVAQGFVCGLPAKVIFEKDGIPYINDGACNVDKSAKEKLDGNFAKLVESVVGKSGRPVKRPKV